MCQNIRIEFLLIELRALDFDAAQDPDEVSESEEHTRNRAMTAMWGIGRPFARSYVAGF